MKNNEISTIFQTIANTQENSVLDLPGEKFSYALVKNLNKMKSHLKHLYSTFIVNPEYREYEIKKNKINEENDLPENMKTKKIEEYNDEDKKIMADVESKRVQLLKELEEEYKEVLSLQKIETEKRMKLMEEEVEIDFHMIDRENLPELSSRQRTILSFMIVGEANNSLLD